MKDYSKEEMEEGRPEGEALDLIDFCLNWLFEDETHNVEELIGALLVAKDEIGELMTNDWLN